MRKRVVGVAVVVAAAAMLPAAAQAVTIRFARQVAVTQNVTSEANLLGAGDAQFGGFFGAGFAVPGDATLSDFGDAQTYSTVALAALLGVSEAALLAADAITVEVNGLPSFPMPDSYETSTHTFDDGVGSRSVSNAYLGAFGTEIISRASVSAAAYDVVFGTTTAPPAGGVLAYAFLLFDFDAGAGDAVDATAAGFTWRVLGGDLGVGSPDPDFFGVIVPDSVPEPGSLALLLLGAAVAAAARRR